MLASYNVRVPKYEPIGTTAHDDEDQEGDEDGQDVRRHPAVYKALLSYSKPLFFALAGSLFISTWIASAHLAWQLTATSNRNPSDVAALDSVTDHDPADVYPGVRMMYGWKYCNGVHDPAGARKRNCVFDPIHGGWIHRACHDEELYKEFVGLRDFDWFADANHTIPLTQEFVFSGEAGGRSYTRDDYHYRHCEFIIKSLFKNVALPGKGLGMKLVDRPHLDHCLDRLINYNTPDLRESYTETVQWVGSAPCYIRL